MRNFLLLSALLLPLAAQAAPGGGGKMGAMFTPEQRAMYMMDARSDLKGMDKDKRKDWRKEQIAKIMAMPDNDRAKMKADLQAKWDALPQAQKDAVEKRIAMRESKDQ